MKNQFSLTYKITVGADFLTKELKRDKDTLHLQIWDTAGSERFHSITQGFYRNTEVCVLVFDQTSPESFEQIDVWRNQFLEALNPPEGENFPFVLLGNKNDRQNEIKVKQENIDNYCLKHNNMPYYSVSALNSNNIEEAFNKIADMAFNRNIQNEDILLPEIKPIQIEKPSNGIKCCQ